MVELVGRAEGVALEIEKFMYIIDKCECGQQIPVRDAALNPEICSFLRLTVSRTTVPGLVIGLQAA